MNIGVPEQPECISIVVADEVYQDRDTGKHVVAGAFSRIWARSAPVRHPRLTVFFTLTNARGTSDLSLAIEHEESGATLIELNGPYECYDPLQVMDFVVHLGDIVFPAFGKYWVQVKSESRILQQRPLFLEEMEAINEASG